MHMKKTTEYVGQKQRMDGQWILSRIAILKTYICVATDTVQSSDPRTKSYRKHRKWLYDDHELENQNCLYKHKNTPFTRSVNWIEF
jgi:hypothetical protein